MDKLHINYIITGGLLSVTIIASAAMTSINVNADDAVDVINITVPTACTMGGTIVQGEEHSTSLQPGTYEPGIGKTTLTTYCNDPGGFSIYAIGFTGDVYTGANHTKLVGNTAANTISTGLTTGTSTTDVSSWAMKLSAVTGAYAPTVMDGTNGSEDFTDYHVVPDTFTKVATYGNTTDAEGGTGSSLETTYAVYASLTQPADTYTGKVKYTLVHPNSFTEGNYSVVYKSNGGTGTDVTISNIVDNEPYIIAASTFTAPSGYQLAGWCTIQDNTQSPQTSCSGGTLYQPDDIATSLASAGGTFNLYAIWSKLPYSSCSTSPMISTVASGINYMQDITSSNRATVLASLATDATYQIKDNRDNETYCVSKLADGNLWMLDNLALDLTDSNILNSLSSSNTNASTGLPYLKGTSTGTTSDQYATAKVTNWTSSSSYSAPLINMASKDVIPTDATSQAGGYKIGGYYNYCAASAGSYCYSNGTDAGTSSGNATEDICPAGWRMPTGNTGEFRALGTAITGVSTGNYTRDNYTAYRAALHLPLSGFHDYSSPYYRGGIGGWWSSTRSHNYGMYGLFADTSTIYPANDSYRSNGYSLRCVAGS